MSRKRKPKTKVFVLSWDNEGLESVVPVSDIEARNEELEKERVLQVLSDPEGRDPGFRGESVAGIIHRMQIRAQINCHRHYEIYSVCVDASIDAEQLRDMFEQSPQDAADLIRERGNKIYSNRRHRAPVIV